MGKIKILQDTLISQIAAGEVVERPASVVKELLENSLDAGAAFCSIEIEQGGMRLIAVRDNGCGMDAEDAKMAFARHATSKIATLDDLVSIKTLGFRGEALAAIASVSMVTLRTRPSFPQTIDVGTEVVCKGGNLESVNSAGCAPGAEIIVRNLFFNTPARRKFLKSETTELGHIVSAVSHIAIANPAVGFELKHNGKTLFHAPQNSSGEERVSAVLGRNLFEELAPVFFKTETIHIYGFIGAPGMALSSKRHQYLFVNGRDVGDAMVSRAVSDAYGSRLPGRQWPMFVLHIDLDPKDVDVNVHPRKLAVKFLEQQKIYRDVVQAASQALGRKEQRMPNLACRQAGSEYRGAGRGDAQAALEFTKQFVGQDRRTEGLEQGSLAFEIIAQIADSYILVFDEEGLVIIDQHAAHERILYEKFKSQALAGSPQIQQLLAPINIECSYEEAIFLRDALPHLQKMGFEFEEWSGNTFVIRGCPLALKNENIEKIFREFIDSMTREQQTDKILPERILKTMACKSAVNFGMKISAPEQQELLAELSRTPNNSTCPHGRPTRVKFTFEELERRFYRRK